MIITVYAIAKNEEKFALRWYESMKEADHVVVLDTGSTDNTVQLLREAGAVVESKIIEPWRFDEARNASLELVPEDTDVCICTDLDEVFEPNWREKLERAWVAGTERGRYRYIWSHTDDGAPGVEFLIEKAHARKGFKWVNAVHEVLVPQSGNPKTVTLEGVTVHHYPDANKSREAYLSLLELAVKENPDNDRNMHYLGREYMYKRRYTEAITTLKRHLNMPTARWADERAASMRYVARCELALGRKTEAESWLMRAAAEAPYVREAYVEYARLLYAQSDWHGVVFWLKKALAITSRSDSYINEPDCWGALPYDLISLAYYYTGDYEAAVSYVDEAINRSGEQRLKDNRRFFAAALEKSKGAEK